MKGRDKVDNPPLPLEILIGVIAVLAAISVFAIAFKILSIPVSIGVKDGIFDAMNDQKFAPLLNSLLKNLIDPLTEIVASLKGDRVANTKKLENIEALLTKLCESQAAAVATDISVYVYARYVGSESWDRKLREPFDASVKALELAVKGYDFFLTRKLEVTWYEYGPAAITLTVKIPGDDSGTHKAKLTAILKAQLFEVVNFNSTF
jgi:hypothetical protein